MTVKLTRRRRMGAILDIMEISYGEKYGIILNKVYGKILMIQQHFLSNGQKLICRRLSEYAKFFKNT